MGTNYYLYNSKTKTQGKHIGKASSIGHGKIKFTWAIESEWVADPNIYMPFVCVIDEYGETMNLFDFKKMIDECGEQDHSFVDTEFS